MNNTTSASDLVCGVYIDPFKTIPAVINLTIVGLVHVSFFLLGTFMNAFVLFIFSQSSLLRRKVGFFLMAVLCGVDLAVVSIVHVLALIYVIGNLMKIPVCTFEVFYNGARHLLCSFSSYVLIAVSIERYIAVLHPFSYAELVTTRRLIYLVIALWLLILVEWLVAFFVAASKGIVVIAQLGLFFLVTFLAYSKIFFVARKKMKEDMRVAVCGSVTERHARVDRQKRRLSDYKLSSAYVLLTISFLFCFLPTIIAYGLQFVHMDKAGTLFAIFLHFREWTRTFVTLNSTFNCFIFFWKNSFLRKEKNKILERLRS